MLGDVAVAVHPDNEKLKHLIGKTAILPLVGRRIPIVGDDYADPEKGTGAVKITPAHDFNDFEVGKRHDLPQVSVLDVEGKLALKDNEAFLAGVPKSADLDATMTLHGVDRFKARKIVVERLEAAGLLDKIEPHTHMVPHGDRSNVVIEPFLTDQWYVNAKALAVDGHRRGARGQDQLRAEELGEDLFRLDGEHPAVVHLAAAVVGPPDSGVVRAGRQGLRRRDRGRRPSPARSPTTRRPARSAMRRRATWRRIPTSARRS